MPHMESSSVFAAILDMEKGGHFSVRPQGEYHSAFTYVENTNVLQTHFESPKGRLTLTDFMPIPLSGENGAPIIFRKIESVEGSAQCHVHFEPRFDYGRINAKYKKKSKGIVASAKKQCLFLNSSIPLKIDHETATADFQMDKGEIVWFVLQYDKQDHYSSQECEDILLKTIQFWIDWSHKCEEKDRCVFGGPWHKAVVRSALVLKLLTHRVTGAICAAPTTSLPESIGGIRNRDYRFNWVRDGSFTVQALFNLGHQSEAIQFLKWFGEICRNAGHPSELQVVYGLHGETDLEEQELDHLSGYINSKPVRIGNGAAKQKQWDIYGELINAVWELSRYGEEITEDVWGFVAQLVDYVCEIWSTPDSGIWEVLGKDQHFVYSKLMCWVALDRGIRIARQRKYYHRLGMWQSVRETIRLSILQNGFDDELNCFVQTFGSKNLDATGLLIPMMGFLPFDDPKVQGTIEAVKKHLSNDQGFIYRYLGDDGLPGSEGVSILCTFWMVNVLALSGQQKEAEKLFQRILDFASPLGLFAEELESSTGTLQGNFPQAFCHIGLINSALYLGIAAGLKQMGPEPLMSPSDRK